MLSPNQIASKATSAAKGKRGKAAAKAVHRVLRRHAGTSESVETPESGVFVWRHTRAGPFVYARGIVYAGVEVPERASRSKRMKNPRDGEVVVPACSRGGAIIAGPKVSLRRNPAGATPTDPMEAKPGDYVVGRFAFLLPKGSLILNPDNEGIALFNQGTVYAWGALNLGKEDWEEGDARIDARGLYRVILRGSAKARRAGADVLANAAKIQMRTIGLKPSSVDEDPEVVEPIAPTIPVPAPAPAPAPAPKPKPPRKPKPDKPKGPNKAQAIAIIESVATTGDIDGARKKLKGLAGRTTGAVKKHYGVTSIEAALKAALDRFNADDEEAAASPEVAAEAVEIVTETPAPTPAPAPAPAGAPAAGGVDLSQLGALLGGALDKL